MSANWSLVLESILLAVVIITIQRFISTNRKRVRETDAIPLDSSSPKIQQAYADDIIAVRKIPEIRASSHTPVEAAESPLKKNPNINKYEPRARVVSSETTSSPSHSGAQNALYIFLQAKEKRTFAGYELLQTLLAAGLRYGEGQLFHRHQEANGKGPVLCSLAAATSAGVFDLSNIGAFSSKGLCLFMRPSHNVSIDTERFSILIETARELADDLDAEILDDARQPLTEESMNRYARTLGLSEPFLFPESELATGEG